MGPCPPAAIWLQRADPVPVPACAWRGDGWTLPLLRKLPRPPLDLGWTLPLLRKLPRPPLDLALSGMPRRQHRLRYEAVQADVHHRLMLAVGNWFYMLQHNTDWSEDYINVQCLNMMQYIGNIVLGAGQHKGKGKGKGKKGKEGKGKKGKGKGNDDTDTDEAEDEGDSDEDPADLEDIGASNRKGPPPPPGGASSKRKLIC